MKGGEQSDGQDMGAFTGGSKSLPILYICHFSARMHHSNTAALLRTDVHLNGRATSSFQQTVRHSYTSTRHTDFQAFK
jgi:hypothetical protein